MKADISAISRHRIGIDGDGVTTLVVFMSCPLRCKYCLNPQTLSKRYPSRSFTVGELFDEVRVDELYFLATGGGVTFGGGEPLLNSTFIKEFRNICGKDWKINLETSLNVPLEHLQEVADCVDTYIIDVKDMAPDIYKEYTGRDNFNVFENLKHLSSAGKADSCIIRVPVIPGFNEDRDVDSSIDILKSMGFIIFDRFKYTTQIHGDGKRNL